ncbi:hypothetical protein TR2A62_2240 [Thalassobium sp. R2A62]|nr:hypothetical protein TR2A62_2240 [Thalassobium sp. R2A62]
MWERDLGDGVRWKTLNLAPTKPESGPELKNLSNIQTIKLI